jgi:PAS domain S-box-containing protein
VAKDSPKLVFTLDEHAGIASWSESNEELTGWTAEAVVGKKLASLLFASGTRDPESFVLSGESISDSLDDVMMDVECEDGSVKRMHVQAYPLEGTKEGPVTTAIVCSPIADEKTPNADLTAELKIFRSLYDCAVAMTADRKLDENLALIVEQSRKLLGADTGYIALRDETAGDVYMHTLSGIRTDEFMRMRIPFGAGLGGKVATTGRGYIVKDYFLEVGPQLHEIVKSEGLISGIAVPIQIVQTNLGVLYVFNRTKTIFLQSDLDTLALFGNLAAVEISRRRTEDELRSTQAELERRVEERTGQLMQSNRQLELQIQERGRIEAALRESEEKYRAIIENIEEAYYEVDLHGTFTFLNQSTTKILGLDKEDLLSHNFREFLNEEDAITISGVFANVYSTGRPMHAFSWSFCPHEGQEKVLEASISLIKDSQGRPSGFRGICRDIAEHRQAQDELIKLEKLESIGVLAGGIAHDFNNILTGIQGNISLAKMLAEPRGMIYQRLAEAEKATQRAGDLTQQLLTFSKGGAPIKRATSISEIVVDSCEFALRGSNVRCLFFLPDDIWTVELDEAQISQVIGNLIINADHAMPEGGTIEVRAENVVVSEEDGLPLESGNHVAISIHDAGSGIRSDHLGKIFDPYFTTKHKGSGLGLATSYSIVKNHAGLITVESELGTGTVFNIYLPASDRAIVHRTEIGDSPLVGSGSVLVMDDEDTIRELAGEMLTMMGLHVELAKEGAEAVRLYKESFASGHPFDVVILDLTVPGGMGGSEAIKRLTKIDPNVRAIVSSGYSNDPIMGEFKNYGFSGVVAKPYSMMEIGQAVMRLIGSGDGDKQLTE